MSSAKTDKLQLNKWVPTDYVNMNEFNDNFQKIDDAHKDVTTQLAEKVTVVTAEKFGAKGDYDPTTKTGTDDTLAIQQAIDYAISNKLNLFLPKKYLVTSDLIISNTLTGALRQLNISGLNINVSGLYVKNKTGETTPITLFTIGSLASKIYISDLTIYDEDIRRHTAIRYYDTNEDAIASWKNDLSRLHIRYFNKTIVLDGHATDPTKDAHLDGLTLNKVGIWDYNIGIEFNNMQAVQVLGHDVDFITTHDTDSNSIAIKNLKNSSWKFYGGSWIGRGIFALIDHNPTKSGTYVIEKARFEFRSTSTKPMIKFAEALTATDKNVARYIDLLIKDCNGIAFGQNVTLLESPVVGVTKFENCQFNSGYYSVKAYRTSDTISTTSENSPGGHGKILIENSTPIDVQYLEDVNKYPVAPTGIFPYVKISKSNYGRLALGGNKDTDNFYSPEQNTVESVFDNSFRSFEKKTLMFRTSFNTEIPKFLALKIPKSSLPTELVFSLKNENIASLGVEIHLVKNKANWSSPFTLSTDGIKLKTIIPKDLFQPGDVFKNFVVPIDSSVDYETIVGGKTLTPGNLWSEGRMIIRFYDTTTGSSTHTQSVPVSYIGINYY